MIYYFSICFAIIFIVFVILLVRNNKLDEKYSILWLIFSILVIILALCTKVLDKISSFLGIFYAPALLFLFGFIFVIFYIIHLSTVVTKQNKSIIRLTQEIAILKNIINKNDNDNVNNNYKDTEVK